MVNFPTEVFREPTADDVLRIDPVNEYERRRVFRQMADSIVKETGDDGSSLVERGRPTGP